MHDSIMTSARTRLISEGVANMLLATFAFSVMNVFLKDVLRHRAEHPARNCRHDCLPLADLYDADPGVLLGEHVPPERRPASRILNSAIPAASHRSA